MISKRGNDIGEDEVMALLHKGNEKALALIFREHHVAVFYFALQYVKDRMVAEDIVAEGFIKLWQKRRDFDNMSFVRSFLFTVVKNGCLNHLKRKQRHATCHKEIKYLSPEYEELFPEQKMIKSELLQDIWRNIEQLPPVRRRIFKMIYFEGLETFEIARILQISADTVRVQKAKALHTLRAIVNPHYNKSNE